VHNGSSNNFPCYPPDSHQPRNAVRWREEKAMNTQLHNKQKKEKNKNSVYSHR